MLLSTRLVRFAPLAAIILPLALFVYVRQLPTRAPARTVPYVKPQAWSTTRAAQRFIFGPPPRKGQSMPYTLPKTATGAGYGSANGEYTTYGTYEGEASGYNGTLFLLWDGTSKFVIASDTSEPPSIIYYESGVTTADNFPVNGWSPVSGAGPAPTFSVAAVGPSSAGMLQMYRQQGH